MISASVALERVKQMSRQNTMEKITDRIEDASSHGHYIIFIRDIISDELEVELIDRGFTVSKERGDLYKLSWDNVKSASIAYNHNQGAKEFISTQTNKMLEYIQKDLETAIAIEHVKFRTSFRVCVDMASVVVGSVVATMKENGYRIVTSYNSYYDSCYYMNCEDCDVDSKRMFVHFDINFGNN